MIHVIATVTLAPGPRGRFLEVLNENVPNDLAEDDAETDIPSQPPRRPDVVVVVENWRDLAALKAHSTAPHMTAYRAKAKDCILSVSLQVLDPA